MTKKRQRRKSNTDLAPAPSDTSSSSRKPSADATIVGKAKPRASGTIGEGLEPPDAGKDASDAAGNAIEAARRARKKGAASTLLTGMKLSSQAPLANVGTKRTLLGGR